MRIIGDGKAAGQSPGGTALDGDSLTEARMMNGRVSLAIALALLFCTAGSHASQCNKWRLGGSYSQFTDSSTYDRLGGAWGVIGEYSFYDALQEDMDQITGDISVFVYYRRYDNSFRGVDFTNNYTSIGLRWRGGRGALPSCDGFYGGVGVACAIVRISPPWTFCPTPRVPPSWSGAHFWA